ncbi:MAG TPA: efflux RND transporter permease subunit [Steroidobacteraceae bacterium]|nr:efflux RND transporter permease subunit [Steroidobacteraceae bacterium]
MRLIDFATRRRVTVVMCMVALCMFGLVSLSRMKVNLLPDLSYPTLTVRTELTGAAPLEIENLITRPVEEAVGIIRNVRQVRSVSRSGQSDVILEFLWGTDMDLAGIEVREKLDLLQLPLEAERPLLLRFDPSSEPVMRLALLDTAKAAADAAGAGLASEERLKFLRRFAEDRLKPDLEAVEGSAAVKVSGGFEDEIQVFVDQQKIAQLGLSIETVAMRLRAENVNLSGGRLEQGAQRFLVRTLNEFQTVDEMANAIIASVDGQPVYLRDVATVTRGYKEREAVTRVDGRESIELAVYKEGDANTVQLADGIRARMEALSKTLPRDTELKAVYDQSKFIASAIAEVRDAALWGGLLTILVLYFFLRDARATFVTAIVIPVSVIGTFMLMYSSDVTLNIMSLGGIALSVGMLVDNSVVILESITRKREAGMPAPEAARSGTSEVAMAVIASTLTSIAVFFPMVFISGVAGQLFRDQALTVTYGQVLSLLVGLTVVPMMVAGRQAAAVAEHASQRPLGRFSRGVTWVTYWINRAAGAVSRFFRFILSPFVWLTQTGYRKLEERYVPLLQWALAHRAKVVIAAVVLFALTMAIVPRLGTELIPQLSQGEYIVDLRLPPGTPLNQTDRVVESAQRASQALGGVALTYSVAGTGNRLDANPVDAGENTGKLSVTLVPGSGRAEEAASITALRDKLEGIAGLQYQFSRPALFSFSTPLEVVISGYDLDRLRVVAEQVRTRMEESGSYTDIRSTVEIGNPEIQIVFDQDRATRLGLAVRDIADRVVRSVRGEVATRYRLRDKQIDVLVRSVDSRAASIEEIRSLIVNPGSAHPVPLSAVAAVTLASGPAEVRRIGQERVAVISAGYVGRDLGAAVTDLQGMLAGVALPPGVSAYLSGQSEEMQDSFRSLAFTLALAVLLVYLVMASQFESLVQPFVILFTIPLGLIGVVWALFLTGTTVNVVAMIGLIMLAGIVVNNAIVLIDAVNQGRERGLDKAAAILEAGRVRLRPILITTVSTVLGLLPMAIGFGEGAEVRTPMAITVIGGITVSTLLTLVVIPVVYSLMTRERRALDVPTVTMQPSRP